MPSLIPEIFFDVGKRLIEDGNSDAVFRFAFSGKEHLATMKKVFSSVTILKLYNNHFGIGWGNKNIIKSEFQIPQLQILMKLGIGNCVKNLHIDEKIPEYQPILDRIIAKRQLFSFSAGVKCRILFLNKFLPIFSSTLKHVKIPNSKMTPTFRDSLSLDSLTILDPNDYRFAVFCCKTNSLNLVSGNKDYLYNQIFENPTIMEQNSNLTLIKEINFNHTWIFFGVHILNGIMKYFSSLESLKFNAKTTIYGIQWYLPMVMNSIALAPKLPSKITCSFQKFLAFSKFPDLETSKTICKGFEYDEIRADFYRFTRMLPSADEKSTLFEVQIFN